MMKKTKIAFGKISLNVGVKTEQSSLITTAESTTSSSVEPIGSFGTFNKIDNTSSSSKEDVKEDADIASMMGFSGFGKKAREFDVEKLAEDARKDAEERNRANIEKMAIIEENDDEVIGPMPPIGNLKEADDKSKPSTEQEDSDEDLIGPPLPPNMIKTTLDNKTKTKPESDDSDAEDGYRLPITLELPLNHGEKAITSLAMDPSGSRLVSGAVDYDVKYWDFQGMDVRHECFRTFVPYDGYPIHSVDYSCSGDKVLVVTGSPQAKVYDRDGIELFECTKGDMYIQDMAKTKGHISSITHGCWHTRDKEEFLTSSRDGTCRIWHTSKPLCQMYVIKPKTVGGLKAKPTACCYSRDGLTVACGSDDGSVQMWDHRKSYVNTIVNARDCHTRGTEITSICFSYDNKYYATRGIDDTLKLWDIRKPKTNVFSAVGIFNRFDMTDCLFSPNDQLVVTGTSMNKTDKSGKLVMFNRNTWKLEHDLSVGNSHVISIVWHPKLNQICVGSGDGKIRILYDKDLSRNGALLAAGKKHKRQRESGVVVSQQIITPHALPMFKEEMHKSTRKLELKDRKDPVRSHRPELPLGGAGTGGRVSAGGSTLSSYIIRNMGLKNKQLEDDGDPREALLKYAKLAEEDPYWVSPAYTATQPKPIFREEKEDNNPQEKKKQKTS